MPNNRQQRNLVIKIGIAKGRLEGHAKNVNVFTFLAAQILKEREAVSPASSGMSVRSAGEEKSLPRHFGARRAGFSTLCRNLDVPASRFQKVIVTPARSIGTYRQKTKHGVLTIYYHNKKLRDILCTTIENL